MQSTTETGLPLFKNTDFVFNLNIDERKLNRIHCRFPLYGF